MQAHAPQGSEVVQNPSQDAPSPKSAGRESRPCGETGGDVDTRTFLFLGGGFALEGLDTRAEAAAFTRGPRAYSIASSAAPEAEAATKQGIGDNDQ